MTGTVDVGQLGENRAAQPTNASGRCGYNDGVGSSLGEIRIAVRLSRFIAIAAMATAPVGCGNGDGGGGDPDGSVAPSNYHCDADSLAAALAMADSQDAVGIGDCTITGSFTVPPGVTLTGQSQDKSTLQITSASGGLTLEVAEDETTVLRGLTIETDYGQAAVVGSGLGKGAIRLDDVTVEVTVGVGAAFSNIESLTLVDVTFQGPLALGELPSGTPSLSTAAMVGLSVADVASAAFTNLVVSGFETEGIRVVDSVVDPWTGGNINGNAGRGAVIDGGSAHMTDVEACQTVHHPEVVDLIGAGLVISGGATVTTDGLVSDDNNYGTVHLDGAIVSHTELTSSRNQLAAMWVQDAATVDIVGPNHIFEDNVYRALYIIDSDDVSIENLTISGRSGTTGPTMWATPFRWWTALCPSSTTLRSWTTLAPAFSSTWKTRTASPLDASPMSPSPAHRPCSARCCRISVAPRSVSRTGSGTRESPEAAASTTPTARRTSRLPTMSTGSESRRPGAPLWPVPVTLRQIHV